MGGSIEYVYRDGSRLTPWMLYVINRASAELHERFGCELLVTSGIRTNAEQTAIFLDKYRVQWFGSGSYKDVRWWKGKRYVRVKGGGTVAPPSKSNHEIQGAKAAADLRDSGRDAGVSRGGNARANWLRANAPRLGLIPSGYGFGEPWHYDIPDIFRTPPAMPAGGNATTIDIPAPEPEEEEDDMYRPTVHARTDGKTETEWMLGHPDIGKDLPVFTGTATDKNSRLSADKTVKTFRGFMVTVNRDIATAWARTHAKGSGQITSSTDRDGYIEIQKELSRISGELG